MEIGSTKNNKHFFYINPKEKRHCISPSTIDAVYLSYCWH